MDFMAKQEKDAEEKRVLKAKLGFLEDDARRVLDLARLLEERRSDDSRNQQHRYGNSIKIELAKIKKSVQRLSPLLPESHRSVVILLQGAIQDLEKRQTVSKGAAQSLVTRISGLKSKLV